MTDDEGDEEWLREHAITWLRAMLTRPLEPPERLRVYIAARLLPILEAEEAAAKGRPGVPRAGEMVQAYKEGLIGGGMEPAAAQRLARKLVETRTGMKYASVSSAHIRFLKSGQQALLYGEAMPFPKPR